jgi:hypothetical protein
MAQPFAQRRELESPVLVRFAEHPLVVPAPLRNADYCHGLIQDGVGDHDALSVADRP